MPKYILEVYERRSQLPEEYRWTSHHCDGIYDDAIKLNMAILEALADPVVQYVKVRIEEDD